MWARSQPGQSTLKCPVYPMDSAPSTGGFWGSCHASSVPQRTPWNFPATKDASTVSVDLEGLRRPAMSLVFMVIAYALAPSPATACVGRWLSKGRGWWKKPQNIRTPGQPVHPRLLSPTQTQWLDPHCRGLATQPDSASVPCL